MRRQVIAISVLMTDCSKGYARKLSEQIREQLATDQINGSVGVSFVNVPVEEDE